MPEREMSGLFRRLDDLASRVMGMTQQTASAAATVAEENKSDKTTSNSAYYTSHMNWEWIVDQAMNELFTNKVAVKKFSELPSIKQQDHRVKPTYALFRVEIVDSMTSMMSSLTNSVWCHSQVFGYLDPKDALFRILRDDGLAHLMPDTYLLPWDINDPIQVRTILWSKISGYVTDNKLPFDRMLLKSAIGSGGSGLYFVESMSDIVGVIRNHAIRAQRYEGFLEGLRKSHQGEVPSWCLQRLADPVRALGSRKTQVRAYVCACGERLFLCNQFEVRLPYWENEGTTTNNNATPDVIDERNSLLDSTTKLPPPLPLITGMSTDEDVEVELTKGTSAIPYNANRIKSNTERLLLDEVEELRGAEDELKDVVIKAMLSIRPHIFAYQAVLHRSAGNVPRNSMGVAGIDLIVEKVPGGFRAFLLEVNNNPAMPGPDKRMSERYRKHLVSLVGGFIRLGLSAGDDSADGLFTQIY